MDAQPNAPVRPPRRHQVQPSVSITKNTGCDDPKQQYGALIYHAARDGKLERLKIFLDSRSEEWARQCLENSITDKQPAPAVVIAARHGHLEVVEYLISKGANPKATGTVAFDGEVVEDAPALWAAAAAGHLPVVQALIRLGADVNQTTSSHSTPLRGACYDGHLDVVRYLVSLGADCEMGNRYGHTPLMIASYRNKIEVVRFLLESGADPCSASHKGNTALHDAAEAGCLDVTRILLAAGADVEAKDEHGVTPLLCAAAMGFDEVVEVLAELASTSGRSDAWKLLGSTVLDKRRDSVAAIEMWSKALKIDEEQNCRSFPIACQNDKVLLAARERAYGNWEQYEIANEDELKRIMIDSDVIRMQALVIRERILGIGHPETHYHIKYRGAIYADMGRLDRCIALWQYALLLQQCTWPALQGTTRASLSAFVEMFVYCMTERALVGQRVGRIGAENAQQIGVETVIEVLGMAIKELERFDGNLQPTEPQETVSNSPFERLPTRQDLESTMTICLQLLVMIGRLFPTTKTWAKTPEAGQLEKLSSCTEMIKRLDIVCRRHNLQPLHVACQESPRSSSTRFPSMFVIRQILAVRTEAVNEKNEKGETPLQILLACDKPRQSMIKLLLENGAELLARNANDENCLQLINAKVPQQRRQAICLGRFLTLKGLAANAVRRCRIHYETVVPIDLLRLVNLH